MPYTRRERRTRDGRQNELPLSARPVPIGGSPPLYTWISLAERKGWNTGPSGKQNQDGETGQLTSPPVVPAFSPHHWAGHPVLTPNRRAEPAHYGASCLPADQRT